MDANRRNVANFFAFAFCKFDCDFVGFCGIFALNYRLSIRISNFKFPTERATMRFEKIGGGSPKKHPRGGKGATPTAYNTAHFFRQCTQRFCRKCLDNRRQSSNFAVRKKS